MQCVKAARIRTSEHVEFEVPDGIQCQHCSVEMGLLFGVGTSKASTWACDSCPTCFISASPSSSAWSPVTPPPQVLIGEVFVKPVFISLVSMLSRRATMLLRRAMRLNLLK